MARKASSPSGNARREPELTSADRAMLKYLDALYGPLASTQRPTDAPGSTKPEPRTSRAGLLRSVLGTLLLVSTAFLAWYALAGGEASVQRTVELLNSTLGERRGTPETAPTPEYVLAVRTMQVDRLAPDDPLVLQFKALLDALAPKCKENRAQLANVVIDVHAARLRRGVETPYLNILAQVDAALSTQTRSLWPTSCAELLTRMG